jgi:predicted DNA-binding ribbon-helix-helix protein
MIVKYSKESVVDIRIALWNDQNHEVINMGRKAKPQPARIRVGYRYCGVDLKNATWAALTSTAEAREIDTADLVREIFREWISRQPEDVVAEANLQAARMEADQLAAVQRRPRRGRSKAGLAGETPTATEPAQEVPAPLVTPSSP